MGPDGKREKERENLWCQHAFMMMMIISPRYSYQWIGTGTGGLGNNRDDGRTIQTKVLLRLARIPKES